MSTSIFERTKSHWKLNMVNKGGVPVKQQGFFFNTVVDKIHMVNWAIIMMELAVGQIWPFLHIVAHTFANISMVTGLTDCWPYQNKTILHCLQCVHFFGTLFFDAMFFPIFVPFMSF